MNKRRLLIITLMLGVVLQVYAGSSSEAKRDTGKIVETPYGRFLKPAGYQVVFGEPSLENHAMDCALSADGKWLAVEERYSIIFINTDTREIAARFPLNSIPGMDGAMNTYSGITWYTGEHGQSVWWSAAGNNNLSYVFEANWNGQQCTYQRHFTYKAVPPAHLALANELLLSRESGKTYFYVVLNGNNEIIKQDLENGDTVWKASTGVAPYGITRASGKLYVTNWGGRKPDPGDPNVAGVPWGEARVDPQTGATREGSVSVIDPVTGATITNIVTGLHPNEITSSTDGRFVYLTTSNSDAVFVINTSADSICEEIPVRLQPEINPYFGDSPNGLGLSPDGRLLYVTNGMDNALVVIKLGENASIKGKGKTSTIMGFIPTGAYPSSVVASEKNILYVTNLEGDSRKLPIPSEAESGFAYNSHHMLTSVSIIEKPRQRQLKRYTNTVIAMNQLSRLGKTGLPPRRDILPAPVPERTGEPSVFRHVLYIIKENRTYDQVLGDMLAGEGDPSLCTYGDTVTPNTHKLAEQFLLLDNYAVAGKCSAEGHQWTDAAIVTDYIEKNMRAWFRSYPHVQTDALVYAPTGFLWDNAVRHGKRVKIYGEAAIPEFDHSLTWEDIYKKYKNGQPFHFINKTTIAPVRPLLSQSFPGYDSHKIPDQVRADAFINDLHRYEAMDGDQLPELMIMALPADHTAGTRPGFPTPRAAVADNDLALGRIVEAITNSRFWKETVIFVTEDDSQAGWDHVSPYRTVGLVISPYSLLNKTVHTAYNQQGMVRTIELILGLPPMNIEDAIAAPMYDCFGVEKVEAFYKHIPNRIPLDEMNPPLSALKGKELHYARQSLKPVFDHIDSGEDDLLNRILWYSSKGDLPYPVKLSGHEEDDEE